MASSITVGKSKILTHDKTLAKIASHQVSKDIVVELSQGMIKIVEFIFFHLSYWQEDTSPD